MGNQLEELESIIIPRTVKVKLYPTPEQRVLFNKTCGCCRKIYNLTLETLGQDNRTVTNTNVTKLIPSFKKQDEYFYLKEVPSQALQQSSRDLAQAFSNHYKRPDHFGEPNFKAKRTEESFRIPQGWEITEDGHHIYLPKIGNVKFRGGKFIDGNYKSITIKRDSTEQWYATIVVEVIIEPPELNMSNPVGIDRGVVNFLALSDGTIFEGIDAFRKIQAKIAKLQRKLARRQGAQKGETKSNRYKELQKRINRLYKKARNIRNDIHHKVARQIANNHGYVVLEDLNVKNMTKRAHEKNVKQKSGLNKSILDQGWSSFLFILKYKVEETGGVVELVNPAYTSQTCSVCGYTSKENRVTQEHFECLNCGHVENADVNAAKNILSRGGQLRSARVVNGVPVAVISENLCKELS